MDSPTDTGTTTFTVDKTDPQNADAFAGCKVGDTYSITVTEDDPDHVVLEREKTNSAPEAETTDEGETEPPPGPPGYASKNPAIADMMKRR